MALKKLRAGDSLKGYPADMHNAVVDLVSQPSTVPSDAVKNPPKNFFWVWWKNEGSHSALRGMAAMLGDSFFDLRGEDNADEDQRKNYARDAKLIAFQQDKSQRNGDDSPNSNNSLFSTDYDPRNLDLGGSSEANITSDHAWNNWGFLLDNVPPGKTGRVAIMGIFYVPILVRHTALHFVGCPQYTTGWAMATWHGPGCGEVMWMSEENASFPTNISDSTVYQDRIAIVRLGSASAGSITGYTTSEFSPLNETDPVNPTPGVGTFQPRRVGFPLSSPRRRGDTKLHSYAFDWNDNASFLYDNIKAVNTSQLIIPAGVHTEFDWDANSRCFKIRPPSLQSTYLGSSFGIDGSGVLSWTLEYDEPASQFGLSYASGEFTAVLPVRLDVQFVGYVYRTDGTPPFETRCEVQFDGGGGYSAHDWAYNEISTTAASRHPLTMTTLIDLDVGDKMRFVLFPTNASPSDPEVGITVARLKIQQRPRPFSVVGTVTGPAD